MLIVYPLLFIFSLLYTKATFFWLYLWQIKEYRLDRFRAEYGSVKKISKFWLFGGGRKFFKPVFTLKAIFVYLLSSFSILLLLYYLLKVYFGGFKLIFITLVVGFSDSQLLALFIFGLVIIYLLIPILVGLFVFLLNIVVYFVKRAIYKMAKARLASIKNLVIIGITGSYGKSSTKEFLTQILENKFVVVKTPGNVNTEIGVAKFILQKIKPSDEIFIVEMGAYKIGEIKRICKIAKPKIGIITGVNEQHLALFGSAGNIVRAKQELIECLSDDGTAVFNGDSKPCLEMAEKYRGKKIIYNAANAKVYANNGDLPSHYLQNLAGAISIAKHLGMNEEEMGNAIKSIKSGRRMIKTYNGKKKALVIEDVYSANPDGVMAGLNYLADQKQKTKIVVMPCLIELGEATKNIHQKIGKKIAEVCDLAIITTGDCFNIIKKEAGDKAMLEVVPQKIVKLLNDKLNADTAVLLEGKTSQEVIDFLKKNNT